MTRTDPTTALAESSVARELFAKVASILGADPILDVGPADDYGVIDPITGDVLGANSHDLGEALQDALNTCHGWAQ